MGALHRRHGWFAPLAVWVLVEAMFAILAIWSGTNFVLPAMRVLLRQALEALASG